MAKQATFQQTLQLHTHRLINFLNFTRAFLKRNNPVKAFMSKFQETFLELTTIKKKLKKIEYRINYERYKLKKTELILAQNSDHVFLRGRSLNQTR